MGSEAGGDDLSWVPSFPSSNLIMNSFEVNGKGPAV